MQQKFEIAVYFSCIVTFVFFLIWTFSNIEAQTLFIYYIVAYCLSVLSVLLAPKKLFQK